MEDSQIQHVSSQVDIEKKAGIWALVLFIVIAIGLAALTAWGIREVLSAGWLAGWIVSVITFLPPTLLLTLSFLSKRQMRILLGSWFFFYVWSLSVIGLASAALIEFIAPWGMPRHLWAAGLAILTVAHISFILSRVKNTHRPS